MSLVQIFFKYPLFRVSVSFLLTVSISLAVSPLRFSSLCLRLRAAVCLFPCLSLLHCLRLFMYGGLLLGVRFLGCMGCVKCLL